MEAIVEVRQGLLSQPHLEVGSALTGLEIEGALTLELPIPRSSYHNDNATSQLLLIIPWYNVQGLKPEWKAQPRKSRTKEGMPRVLYRLAAPLSKHYINGPSFNGFTNLLPSGLSFYSDIASLSFSRVQLSPPPPPVTPSDQVPTIIVEG